MNQPNSIQNREASLDELVGYLDGELEDADTGRVEQRLSRDPDYGAKLQELQRTWEMLDHLPRAQVGDAFTQTTVEMVALKAVDETTKRKGTLRLRRVAGGLGVLAAGVLAVFIGYRTTHQRLDKPNRELLEDLPVVENVDLYYHADDIVFVEKLAESGVFDEEIESVDKAPLNQ